MASNLSTQIIMMIVCNVMLTFFASGDLAIEIKGWGFTLGLACDNFSSRQTKFELPFRMLQKNGP